MKLRNTAWFFLVVLLLTIRGNNESPETPLPCGIYDEKARPFIERDLVTYSFDAPRYTMAITTASGKRLAVEVRNDFIKLAGERNHVMVYLDGKLYAKTSHQDLPLYLEVTVDDVKYRIICQR